MRALNTQKNLFEHPSWCRSEFEALWISPTRCPESSSLLLRLRHPPEMAKKVEVGDLVWAKLKGWSPWPGKVCHHTPNLNKPSRSQFLIYFFGTNNYAWIEERSVKEYFEYKDRFSKNCRTSGFKGACSAVEDYIERKAAGIDVDAELFSELDDSEASGSPMEPEGEAEAHETMVNDQDSISSSPMPKKRKSSEDLTPEVEPFTPTPPKKKKASRRNGTKKRKSGCALPLDGTSLLLKGLDETPPAGKILDCPTSLKETVEDVSIDVSNANTFIEEAPMTVTPQKFGFLGLGIMGQGIVKNLLNSGHKVIVWNRSRDKCKDFIDAGADQGMTPADVVSRADITFSCVADSQACKDMVFGIRGVLQEMDGSKSYVEMSGIDVETSRDIEEAISSKGGRYLEAQLQGSKQEADEGELVLLCSGDRSLYDDCLSAFSSIGKSSFFLNDSAGSSAKMNLVLQLISGVMLSGLAEGMALADRIGLEMKDVLEVLALTKMASPFVIEKGEFMVTGAYKTQLPLKHLQKDLNFVVGLGNTYELPLPMAATTNEILKRARNLGYSGHDCSALFVPARC